MYYNVVPVGTAILTLFKESTPRSPLDFMFDGAVIQNYLMEGPIV
jgi:hypothetical protein